ncbi:MAG: hypothetical protein GY797_29330, partial [Deltaproteobacteria bacterium]|nr:hypothetical protein [Deltaproteobacteria bacterium]
MNQKLKRASTCLWIDQVSDDDESLTSDVVQRLEKSAILLLILSSGYLASRRCREVLQEFVSRV